MRLALGLLGLTATLAGEDAVRLENYLAGGQPIPVFSNGLVLVRSSSPSHSVTAYERDGRKRFTTYLRPTGIAISHVVSVAASPSGVVVASISAKTDRGEPSSGLVFLTKDGHIERFVRTFPFAARAVAFAEDGALWATGKTNMPNFDEPPEYNLIHRFSSDGAELGSSISNTTFSTSAAYDQAVLVPRAGGMILVSPRAQEIVELNLDGTEKSRQRNLSIPGWNDLITGASVNKTELFFNVWTPPPPGSRNVGQNVVRYDLTKSDVQPVQLAGVIPARQTLIGSDGGSLVFYESGTIHWVRP